MDKDRELEDIDLEKDETPKSKNKSLKNRLMKLDSETEIYVDTTDMSSEEIKMFRREKFHFANGEIVGTSGKNNKRK